MNVKELYNEDLYGAYLLYGKEVLLIENAVDYLKNKYVDKSFEAFNLVSVSDFENLVQSCETLPVMANKKLIIVSESEEFEKNLLDVDRTLKYLETIPEYSIVIFIDENSKLNKSKKFYKFFKKKKRTVEFDKVSPQEVTRFVNIYFNRENIEISPSDLNYLISKSSYNSKNLETTLMDLKNELSKFLSYKKIDRKIIDSVLTENIDTNIFKLTDAILSRNIDTAITEFKNLYDIGEPLQKTFVLIARSVRLLMGYKKLSEKNIPDYEIMNVLGIGNFELKKVRAGSFNYRSDELVEFFKELEEIDKNIKTTSMDPYTVYESYLFKILSKKI